MESNFKHCHCIIIVIHFPPASLTYQVSEDIERDISVVPDAPSMRLMLTNPSGHKILSHEYNRFLLLLFYW